MTLTFLSGIFAGIGITIICAFLYYILVIEKQERKQKEKVIDLITEWEDAIALKQTTEALKIMNKIREEL